MGIFIWDFFVFGEICCCCIDSFCNSFVVNIEHFDCSKELGIFIGRTYTTMIAGATTYKPKRVKVRERAIGGERIRLE